MRTLSKQFVGRAVVYFDNRPIPVTIDMLAEDQPLLGRNWRMPRERKINGGHVDLFFGRIFEVAAEWFTGRFSLGDAEGLISELCKMWLQERGQWPLR